VSFLKSFRVNRDLPAGRYILPQVFAGLEDVQTLNKCIHDSSLLRRILGETEVTLTANGTRYMHVNDEDGSLVVGLKYLRDADERYLYLDIIHELIHVKQYLDGRELFDDEYNYADRPTEIEAYQYTVEESRRLGMMDEEIVRYLYVEWITGKEFARMLETLGVTPSSGQSQPS
jgi:hypothetical protein